MVMFFEVARVDISVISIPFASPELLLNMFNENEIPQLY